ncbi:hypothetical protein BUALT_Bualt01G0069900 [Buddleja alternifolia]|uniref:FAS1 domain-containing protein n=1 Tax=Buddleja alternifolia TaxID=168488 RepID=A0AAV6Y541_9LAMI|nr:hypothetical protein BUALT_Bualt01G0069900 [Buddleja alternifolia]
MANPSCSQECQAPIYIAMSLTLAFMAIIASTTIHNSTPNTPVSPPHAAAVNASHALRLHGGFHVTATLLQFSPDLFFSADTPHSHTTIFAMQDSAISNLSIPPPALRQLLRYHTAPSALPTAELLKKPPGFCFKTLVNNQNLMITNQDSKSGSIVINNVLISHPDMFLEGPLSVHGVSGPFDSIPSPPCGFSNHTPDHQAVDWTRIIRFLSSNGFVSFAIGLNSFLDHHENRNLGFVTIFAPPNSGFISLPSPLLDRIVKLHIMPQRFSYMELGAAVNSSLRTLITGYDLKIDRFSETLAVNGVEITAPDFFSSEKFVIHGISRAFGVDEFYSTSK